VRGTLWEFDAVTGKGTNPGNSQLNVFEGIPCLQRWKEVLSGNQWAGRRSCFPPEPGSRTPRAAISQVPCLSISARRSWRRPASARSDSMSYRRGDQSAGQPL